MINRTLLYQDLLKKEKEVGVKFTPRIRSVILTTVIECYLEAKIKKLIGQSL